MMKANYLFCIGLMIFVQSIFYCKESKEPQKKEFSEAEQKIIIDKIIGTWQNKKHLSFILEIAKKENNTFTISYLGGEYFLENADIKCDQEVCTFLSAKYPEDSWTIRLVQGQKSGELIIVKAPLKDPKMSYPAREQRPMIEPNSVFEQCPKYICD